MSSAQARVWVVAGAPGAGKSSAAKEFARLLDPPAALLDKDTIYGGFVAAVLAAAARPNGEREGPWYDEHIKVHEYDGMAATARQIRASGCPVVLCAPYTGQIRQPHLWEELVRAVGGSPVNLIWVSCESAILLDRLIQRNSPRDGQRLGRYLEFTAAVQPSTPPAVSHHMLDNSGEGIDSLIRQVTALVARVQAAPHLEAQLLPNENPDGGGP